MQDQSVACPYMPAGMKGCGIRVLSAVSVAVRHSLTGDRNVMRAPIFTDPGSKGRVLLPLVLLTTMILVNIFGSVFVFIQSVGKMRHGFWSRQHEHLSKNFNQPRPCWVRLEVIVL